jgi:type I restriction enzyme, S subunit
MAEQVSSLKTGIKYKNTPIGKIPVDWELVRLGDICSISSGGASNYSKDVNEKTYPVYGSNGILGSYDEFNFSDGLVIGRVGASGSIHMISSPVWASDNTLLLSITDRFAQKLFIYYYLQKCNLPGLATKTAQPLLTQQILKSVLIAKPNTYEQKKIAEILTTLDEAIEKTDQIIEKSKDAKKGLMQKLLTRGIGHKKFKKTEIGEIPEEWDVRKIEEIGEVVTGTTPSTKIKDYYGDKYMFVTPFDMNGYKYVRKTARMLSDTGIKVSRQVPKNSVMVVCIASIGKMAMAFEDCSTNQQINSIICNEKVDPHFIYYLMKSKTPKISSLSGKTAVPIVKKSLFSKLIIQIPSLTEQKQIAVILSSVDEEIEKETNHREQLETLKKGLMQVLLTGKIRVV